MAPVARPLLGPDNNEQRLSSERFCAGTSQVGYRMVANKKECWIVDGVEDPNRPKLLVHRRLGYAPVVDPCAQ